MTSAQKKLYTLRGRIGGIHKGFTKGEMTSLRYELQGSNGNKSFGIVEADAIPYFLRAVDRKQEVLVKGHYRTFREKDRRGRMVDVQRLETIFVEEAHS